MSKKERKKLLHDKWPKKHPRGTQDLIKAIKKASTSGLIQFDDSQNS